MRKILISILAVSLLLSGCVPRNAVKEDNKVSIENKEDIKEETPKEEDKTEKPKEEVKEEKKEQPKETPKVENKNTDKKVAAAPKTTTTNKTTVTKTETKPQNTSPAEQPKEQQPKRIDELEKRLKNAVPNNGKFKVTFERTSGPAPQSIPYYINDFSYELHKNSIVESIVAFNDGNAHIGSNYYGFLYSESGERLNKYKGYLSVLGYKNMPNKADLYVFITSAVDRKTYYEKITYNITSVDVK